MHHAALQQKIQLRLASPAQRTLDANGILTLLPRDERDTKKFKVLTDRELAAEAEAIRVAQEAITGGANCKNRNNNKRPNSAPSIKVGRSSPPKRNTNMIQTEYSRKATTLAELHEEEEAEAEYEEEEEFYDTPRGHLGSSYYGMKTHFRSGGLGVPQKGQDTMDESLHLIKSKYKENLHVIEQLFDEKTHLEMQVQVLQEELQEVAELHPISYLQRKQYLLAQQEAKEEEEEEKEAAAAKYRRSHSAPSSPRSSARPHHSDKRHEHNRHGKKPHANKKGGLFSAADAAELFAQPEEKEVVAPDLKFRAPASLQADVDRYQQRRKAADERERLKKLEQDEYERLLRERNAKAAREGKAFKGVSERERKAREKQEAKMREKKLIEEEEKQWEEMERKQRLSAHVNKERPIGISYDEMQNQEAIQRRERIERRKMELLVNSKAPAAGVPLNKKPVSIPKTAPFRAKDPSKVAAMLQSRQHAWDTKLENTKEQLKAKESVTRASSTHASFVEGMAQREAASAKRRATRLEQQRLREEEKTKKSIEVARRNLEKLANSGMPLEGRRLTISQQVRTQNVYKAMFAEQHEKEKKAEEQAKKRRETLGLRRDLQAAVADREEFRKSQHGNFHELPAQSADDLISAAAAAKDEFRARLRQNQRDLQKKLEDRPSLLQRHAMEVAQKNAADAALGLVGEVTGNDAELFLSDEKWKLGMRDVKASDTCRRSGSSRIPKTSYDSDDEEEYKGGTSSRDRRNHK